MPKITNSYKKRGDQIDEFYQEEEEDNSLNSIIPDVIQTFIKIPSDKNKIAVSKQSTFRIRERNSATK